MVARPGGAAPADPDIDLIACLKRIFKLPTAFATGCGEGFSHLLYTTPGHSEVHMAATPHIELRKSDGKGVQTMLPPRSILRRTVVFSIVSLVLEVFSGGFHHEERLALAGYLLKQSFNDARVVNLLQTICGYQVECRVPDISQYDIEDAQEVVTSTLKRIQAKEKTKGGTHLKEMHEAFFKRLQSYLHAPQVDGPVSLTDHAAQATHSCLFEEQWPSSSECARRSDSEW